MTNVMMDKNDFIDRFLVKGTDNRDYYNKLMNLPLYEGYSFEELFDGTLFENGVYFAGGFWRRLVEGTPLREGDIDLFFKSKRLMDEVFDYITKSEYLEIINVVLKQHATTISVKNKLHFPENIFNIQLIGMEFYHDMDSLLDSFDFTISQIALGCDEPSSEMVMKLGNFTLHDIAKKRLVVNKVRFGVAILRRLIKHTQSGYYACNGCLTAVCKGIRKITDDDFVNDRTSYVD